jgi:tRNA U34 2-thiouridine synthase MnmA/TrmU
MCLKRQGIAVTAIAFVTPFFGAGKARRAADTIGIPLIVRDIGAMHLEMVKRPRYGYGKNMNPCIDCHAMMFRLAGEIMIQEGFDFLFSGEVLGQRPMSQNLSALRAVARYSGYPDLILRPLSARLLPITPMEEQGLVERGQLLDIQGRSRRRQEELAREWGLTDYPSSGGGCLLTEKHFSDRLRDLITHEPACTTRDVELLKTGRQFRLSPQARLVSRGQGCTRTARSPPSPVTNTSTHGSRLPLPYPATTAAAVSRSTASNAPLRTPRGPLKPMLRRSRSALPANSRNASLSC